MSDLLFGKSINKWIEEHSEHFAFMMTKAVSGPVSEMLSIYTAKHIFIKCPNCGQDYPISDSDLEKPELLDAYQQRKGKDVLLQCDQVLPPKLVDDFSAVFGSQRPQCTHKFTLHEGLVEYKAKEPITWYSSGPYMHSLEGAEELLAGQAVKPQLKNQFSWIEHVTLTPGKTASGVPVKAHWKRSGSNMNELIILTSADDQSDLGKPTTIKWHVVGYRPTPKGQDMEPWRRFLIQAANTLLYESNPQLSILESFTAFELFLEKFIVDRWQSPHHIDNLKYLERHPTLFQARVHLHEILGIPFYKSKVWDEWDQTRLFRNQVAHGEELKPQEATEKKLGTPLNSPMEIAEFCYSSIVRAIYFIKYWD
jgi:hypothetical protein